MSKALIIFWIALALMFIAGVIDSYVYGERGEKSKCIEILREDYYILRKDKWEQKSLNNGNFTSDYNIYGGTMYVMRLKPNNTRF